MDSTSSVDEFVLDFDAEEAAQMRAQAAAIAAGAPIPIPVPVSAADPVSAAVRPRRTTANVVGVRVGLPQPTGRTGSPGPNPDRKGAPATNGPAANGGASNKLSELETLRRMIARLERQKKLEAARAAPTTQTLARRQANGTALAAPKDTPTPHLASGPSSDNAGAVARPGTNASATTTTHATAALPTAAPARKRPRIANPQLLDRPAPAAAAAAPPRSASVPPLTTAPTAPFALEASSTAPATLASAAPLRATANNTATRSGESLAPGSQRAITTTTTTTTTVSEASGSAAAPQQPRLIKRRQPQTQARSDSGGPQLEALHHASPGQAPKQPATLAASLVVGPVTGQPAACPLRPRVQPVAANASRQAVSRPPQPMAGQAAAVTVTAAAASAPAALLNSVRNGCTGVPRGAVQTAAFGACAAVGARAVGSLAPCPLGTERSSSPAHTPPECTVDAGGGGGNSTPQSKSRAGPARKRMRPAGEDGLTASASSAGMGTEATGTVGGGQLSGAFTAAATAVSEVPDADTTGMDDDDDVIIVDEGDDEGVADAMDDGSQGGEGRVSTRRVGAARGAPLTGLGTAQREEEGEVISPEAEQAATAFLLSFLTQMDTGGGCPLQTGQAAMSPSQGGHRALETQIQSGLLEPTLLESLHAQGGVEGSRVGRAETRQQTQPQQQQQPQLLQQPQDQRGPSDDIGGMIVGRQEPPPSLPPPLILPSDGAQAVLSNAASGLMAPSPGSGSSARRAAAACTTAAVQRLRRKPSLGTDAPLQPSPIAEWHQPPTVEQRDNRPLATAASAETDAAFGIAHSPSQVPSPSSGSAAAMAGTGTGAHATHPHPQPLPAAAGLPAHATQTAAPLPPQPRSPLPQAGHVHPHPPQASSHTRRIHAHDASMPPPPALTSLASSPLAARGGACQERGVVSPSLLPQAGAAALVPAAPTPAALAAAAAVTAAAGSSAPAVPTPGNSGGGGGGGGTAQEAVAARPGLPTVPGRDAGYAVSSPGRRGTSCGTFPAVAGALGSVVRPAASGIASGGGGLAPSPVAAAAAAAAAANSAHGQLPDDLRLGAVATPTPSSQRGAPRTTPPGPAAAAAAQATTDYLVGQALPPPPSLGSTVCMDPVLARARFAGRLPSGPGGSAPAASTMPGSQPHQSQSQYASQPHQPHPSHASEMWGRQHGAAGAPPPLHLNPMAMTLPPASAASAPPGLVQLPASQQDAVRKQAEAAVRQSLEQSIAAVVSGGPQVAPPGFTTMQGGTTPTNTNSSVQGAAGSDMWAAAPLPPSRLLPHIGQPLPPPPLPQWSSFPPPPDIGMGMGRPPPGPGHTRRSLGDPPQSGGVARPHGSPHSPIEPPHQPPQPPLGPPHQPPQPAHSGFQLPQPPLGAHHSHPPHGGGFHPPFNPLNGQRPAGVGFPAGGAGLRGLGWGEGGLAGGSGALPPPAAPAAASPPPLSLIEVDVLVRKELALIKHRILQQILAENTAEYYECCTMHSRLRHLSMSQLLQGAATPSLAAADAGANLAAADAPAAGPQQGGASVHLQAGGSALGDRSSGLLQPHTHPHSHLHTHHHPQQQSLQQYYQPYQNVLIPAPSLMQWGQPQQQPQRGSTSVPPPHPQQQAGPSGSSGHMPAPQPFPQQRGGGPAAQEPPPLPPHHQQQQHHHHQQSQVLNLQPHHQYHQHQHSAVHQPAQNPLTLPPQSQSQGPQSQTQDIYHNTRLHTTPGPVSGPSTSLHAPPPSLTACQPPYQPIHSALASRHPSSHHSHAVHATPSPTSGSEGSLATGGVEGVAAPRQSSAQQPQGTNRHMASSHPDQPAPAMGTGPQAQLLTHHHHHQEQPHHHQRLQARNEHLNPPPRTAQPYNPTAAQHRQAPPPRPQPTAPTAPAAGPGMASSSRSPHRPAGDVAPLPPQPSSHTGTARQNGSPPGSHSGMVAGVVAAAAMTTAAGTHHESLRGFSAAAAAVNNAALGCQDASRASPRQASCGGWAGRRRVAAEQEQADSEQGTMADPSSRAGTLQTQQQGIAAVQDTLQCRAATTTTPPQLSQAPVVHSVCSGTAGVSGGEDGGGIREVTVDGAPSRELLDGTSHRNSTPPPSSSQQLPDSPVVAGTVAGTVAGRGSQSSGRLGSRGAQGAGGMPTGPRLEVDGGPGVQLEDCMAAGAPGAMNGSADNQTALPTYLADETGVGASGDGAAAGGGVARATQAYDPAPVWTPWDAAGTYGEPNTSHIQPGALTGAASQAQPSSNPPTAAPTSATPIGTTNGTITGAADSRRPVGGFGGESGNGGTFDIGGTGSATVGHDGNEGHHRTGQGTINSGVAAESSAAAPFAGLSFKLQAPGLAARRVAAKRVVQTGAGSSAIAAPAAAAPTANGPADVVRSGAAAGPGTASAHHGTPLGVRPVAAVAPGSIAPLRRRSPAVLPAIGPSACSSAPPCAQWPFAAAPDAAAAPVASPTEPPAAMQPPPQVLLSTGWAAAAGNGGEQQQDTSTSRSPQAQAAPVAPGTSDGSAGTSWLRHPHLTTAAAGSLTQHALHVQARQARQATTAVNWSGELSMQHNSLSSIQSMPTNPDAGSLVNHPPPNMAPYTEASHEQQHMQGLYEKRHQHMQVQLFLQQLQQVEEQRQQQGQQQHQAQQLQQHQQQTVHQVRTEIHPEEEPSAALDPQTVRQQQRMSSSQPGPGDSPAVPPPLYRRQEFVLTAAGSVQGPAGASHTTLGVWSSRYASPLRIFRTYSGSL